MSHEQSETIQSPNGRWINVYGRALPKAGQQLPGTPDYGTVDEAVTAAKARSESFNHSEDEEFEFRMRMEQEAAATPTAVTEPPSALSVAGNAAWKGLAGTGDFILNAAGAMGNALIPPPLRPGAMQDPLRKGFEAVGAIRPENEPQTPGQRILDMAIQSGVSTAVMPAGGAAKVIWNAVTGTVAGALGQVAKEATGSDAIATGVTVATPFLLRGSGGGTTTKLNASTLKTVQDGMKAGYVLPQSKVKPTTIGNALESIGGKAATKQAANAKNIATTDRLAAEELGIRGELTPDAVNAVKASANQVYANIANVSPRAKAALEKLSETRLDASDNWMDYARSRRVDARKAAVAADAKALQYERVIELEARAQGQPGLVKELREARKTLAKVHNIQDAMNVGDGHVSASYIGHLLDNGKPLTGNLRTIGRFAQAYPDITRDSAKVPFAGVSALDATLAAGLGTAGYYGSGGDMKDMATLAALPLLRGPIRSGLLSRSNLRIPGTNLSVGKGYQGTLLKEPTGLDQALLRSILAGRAVAEAQP